MGDEIQKLIEELKGIVLDLHRDAGQLDQNIQDLEFTIKSLSDRDKSNHEYVKTLIQHYVHFRRAHKAIKNFSDLNEREDSIWDKMLLECSKDEQES